VTTVNVAAQQADPHSLLAFYKAMLKLRNGLPSIAHGSYEQAFVDGRLLGYQRRTDGEHSVVLINYATQEAQASVSGLPEGATLAAAHPAGAAPVTADARGVARITVGAQSVQVYTVRASAAR
jgi:alpha-amylase